MIYVGPETVLPLASILAAIGGIILMFWHKTVAVVRGATKFVARLFSRGA